MSFCPSFHRFFQLSTDSSLQVLQNESVQRGSFTEKTTLEVLIKNPTSFKSI
jgi:hypothetical protein